MTRRGALTLVLSAALLFAAAPPDGKRWWSYVEALANDQMRGRDTGSPEHLKAAQYVAEHFRNAGLTPTGTQGFLQPVKFMAWKIVEPQCSLELIRGGKAAPLALGEDAYIGRGAPPAEFVEAPLVFAGYGLTVPEKDYDDFSGLDVKGKIVVMIGGGPSNIPGPLKAHYQNARERNRFLLKGGRGGDGHHPKSHHAGRSMEPHRIGPFSGGDGTGRSSACACQWAEDRGSGESGACREMAGRIGHSVDELLALANAGKVLPHFPLVPSLRAKTKSRSESWNRRTWRRYGRVPIRRSRINMWCSPRTSITWASANRSTAIQFTTAPWITHRASPR